MFNSKAFTLIEILMAIVLIGIIMVVAIPNFLDFGDTARTAVTQERLNALRVAVIGDARFSAGGKHTKMGYESHCLGVPGVIADLATQPAAGTCAAAYNQYSKIGWNGPYVNSADANWNVDAWGTAIVYSSAGRTFTSCGPDLTCATADDIAVAF